MTDSTRTVLDIVGLFLDRTTVVGQAKMIMKELEMILQGVRYEPPLRILSDVVVVTNSNDSGLCFYAKINPDIVENYEALESRLSSMVLVSISFRNIVDPINCEFHIEDNIVSKDRPRKILTVVFSRIT